MEDSDDFQYDSVVSDPNVYSGIFNSNVPDKSSIPADKSSTGNTILTPSTNAAHAENENTQTSIPSDSMPSLAVSTPTSERFQQEYEREMRDHGHFGSQQSQFSLKSGMYFNGSESDIAEKLNGDVMFNGKWSAMGEPRNGHHGRRASYSTVDDILDMQSVANSSDVTLSRLIRESSVDDEEKRSRLQSQFAKPAESAAERHPPSAPTTPVIERRQIDNALVTPKMTRASSDGSVLHSAPGEGRVLRSALRGSRSTGPPPGSVQFDEASISTPRKVSFAGLQSMSSPENSETASTDKEESIEFGPKPKQSNGEEVSMDTQPLDADELKEPDEQQSQPADRAPSPHKASGMDNITGVGVGMSMFRKFAGWSRNHLSQRPLSPAPVADTASADSKRQEPGRAETPMSSQSSSQSASTVSSVQTEPMRSGILSNATTPVSNRNSTEDSLSQTTPRSRPASAKRGLHTPSRSVNPLARHLALKAIRSAPPEQRSQLLSRSEEPSPTNRGQNNASPLIGSSFDEDSAFMDVSDLEKQFAGFANRLKQDAAAVHADVLESEEAWAEMQTELNRLQMQLTQAEAARDFLQQRAYSSDQERAEWEQERQQLLDDKEELQTAVDQWRKRIGDAEKERQGMWSEDMHSRERLLETIADLEEQLRAKDQSYRKAQSEWNTLRDDMAHEVDALLLDYDRLDTEKQDLQTEYDRVLAESHQLQNEYDRMDSENRQLQADVHELHERLADEKEQAAQQQQKIDELGAQINEHEQTNKQLRERLEEEHSQRNESQFFTTAINETMLPPSPKAESKPSDDMVSKLKQQLQSMSQDYDLLTGSLRDAVEAKQEYKEQITSLTRETEALRSQTAELQAKLSKAEQPATDTELEQLREREEQLQRELRECEDARDALNDRLKAQDQRNSELVQRVDEHVQRIARLEMELSDLQMNDSAEELKKENACLQTMANDLETQLKRQHSEGDELRQRLAKTEEKLEQATVDLAQAQKTSESLEAANKKLGSEIVGLHASSKKQLDNAKQNHMQQTSPSLETREVEALESSIGELRQRRKLLEKEKRLLADGLRDVLLHNATLRSELTEILLRRAGKRRELQALQRTESLESDEAGASMLSGLNHVPSTSQLLDSNSKFMHSLDKHLDEVANILEDESPPLQPVQQQQQQTAAKRSTAAHIFAERTNKRLLTPIREETVAAGRMLQDASTQCSPQGESVQQQRVALANAEQERDQFRAAHEEAAERVARLSEQIEEMSEEHERMRAERTTMARTAQRVERQLSVLCSALKRLATMGSPNPDGSTMMEADDVEDTRAMEEDDAMLGATFDRLLENDVVDVDDDLLERIGVAVSEAYAELKRVRRDAVRARRERGRLLKRVAEFERSKLPSYELSNQWGRRVRARSGADGNESLLADDENAEPPASLFLPDESAVLTEIALSKERMNGDEQSQSFVSPEALRDPTNAARELGRLAGLAMKKEKRLRAAEANLKKIEALNHELVAKLDRAYAERIRAMQESNAATRRASARSISRANTPSRSTDWDNIDSIIHELKQCRDKNTDYFTTVEKLCAVLNQHTLDQVLADNDAEAAENMYRKLLVDMAAELHANDALNEQVSIRENFARVIESVKRRLDSTDVELREARSALDVSRLAQEASPDAMRRATTAERRATDLDKQLAELRAQQASDQATLSSLHSTIDRLREHCKTIESQVQETRMERDGWRQQIVAYERALEFQLDENAHMEEQIKQLARQRSRDTQEFVISHGDNSATINWDHINQEATIRADRKAQAHWNRREFALRQGYATQLKVFSWASRMWSSVVRALATHYMRDAPKNDASEAAQHCQTLSRAMDDLETHVEDAAQKADAVLQDALQGKHSRSEFVEILAQIFKELELEFTGSWRDSVQNCIVSLASRATGGFNGLANKLSPPSSAANSSVSASSADPPLSAKKKQQIRERYEKREQKIVQKFATEVRQYRDKCGRMEGELLDANERCKSLVSESQYLRLRMSSETDRVNFIYFQKSLFLRLIGGNQGMLQLVDAKPEVDSRPEFMRRERIRRRWRLVLLAVHMKNRMHEMVSKSKKANSIKERALVRMRSKNSKSQSAASKPRANPAASKQYPDPPMQTQQQQFMPTLEPENGRQMPRNGVFYNYRFQPQQFVGLKSTPHTPSRLRNRVSDVASSNGSSM
ncbi:hypothetical protein EV183_003483 [Coemansia sp. RSA 2336]|nr:hypothetical protein EV183_003483 [Coemansia sp. RSA 2336]